MSSEEPGGVPVLLWRSIRFLRRTREDVDAVRPIRLPALPAPGVRIFVDEDQDPEEPEYLFWSRGARPCLVAAFYDVIDESDGHPPVDEYLDYLIGEARGWRRVGSFWDVYRYSEVES